MGVKLLPAMLFVLAAFLCGLLFLEGRRSPKTARLPATSVLLLVAGILFIVIGKIALFVAVIVLAIILLSSKTR